MRRAAYVNVTFALLAEFLNLPEGHKVVDVVRGANDRFTYRCKILMEGPTFPIVPEGETPPRVTPSLEEGKIEWNKLN